MVTTEAKPQPDLWYLSQWRRFWTCWMLMMSTMVSGKLL